MNLFAWVLIDVLITTLKARNKVFERPQKKISDVWEVGEAYESFMGRWSRLVAKEFLRWLSIPTGSRWMDIGCGTGILSRSILESADPAMVKGIDQASGFVSFAENHIQDPRASFEVSTLESQGSGSTNYDAVVSGLVLNFMSDEAQAVSEMRRVTNSGGVIAAYVWDYAGKMEFLRYFWNAASDLDPQAAMLDEGKRFPICHPEKLSNLFITQGLDKVEVRSIDIQTHFSNFQDYWTPFLSGQGPAPSYVASLSAKKRSALRKKLHSALPISDLGTIDLIARAWAVKGCP